MVMRVERRGDEFCVVLSREALAALNLTDGAEVEVRLAGSQTTQAGSASDQVSVEEALKAYRETRQQHVEAYRELAK
jgi:antitoxin component of MazEF toxin-antitoxin module